MIVRIAVFVFLVIFSQSCSTNRKQQTAKDEKQYTDNEIEALAKKCDYVNSLIAKSMKKAKDKKGQTRIYTNAYQRNDLLFEVLIQTSCLEGQSLNLVEKRLGEPTGRCFREVCWGCQDNIQYDFIIDDANKYTYYICSSGNQVTKILRSKWNIVTSH